MEFLPKEGYKKILVACFYALLGGVLLFIFFRYLLKLLLPFIVAWGIAMVIRPVADKFHKRTGIPKKLISVILIILVIVITGMFLFIIIDKLLYEVQGIVNYVNDNSDFWISKGMELINGIFSKIPFLKTFGSREEFIAAFTDIGRDILSRMTANVPEMLTKLIGILPGVFFVSLILVMASYYLCADYEAIVGYFMNFLPNRLKKAAVLGGKKMREAGKSVLKGYLLTVGITFLQLYVGFLILGMDYALTIALITALVDILPVIGVGTVLVPWAAVKLLAGANYQGFGLLIIFAVVSVVREIIEPKIIGKSIGLHPLATLFSMYIGLETCGFLGMITFPVLLIAIKSFATRKIKQ